MELVAARPVVFGERKPPGIHFHPELADGIPSCGAAFGA